MARTKLEIKFNGTPDYALDLMLNYPRQFIRKVFRTAGETLDVTNMCTADELNRNATWAALEAAGTFSLVVTPGDSDVGDLTPSKTANVGDDGIGIPVLLRKTFAVGGAAGAADDVTVFASNAPYKFRIVDAWVVLSNSEAASSATLRTAIENGGSALSGAIDTGANGIARQAGTGLTATATVAEGGAVYLYRSDRNIAGELFMLITRVS